MTARSSVCRPDARTALDADCRRRRCAGGGRPLDPVLINPERYWPEIISYVEENTGKTTEIEGLALTFFPRVTVYIYGSGREEPLSHFPPVMSCRSGAGGGGP